MTATRCIDKHFDDLDAPVERVGMAEVPPPYAKNLETGGVAASDPRPWC